MKMFQFTNTSMHDNFYSLLKRIWIQLIPIKMIATYAGYIKVILTIRLIARYLVAKLFCHYKILYQLSRIREARVSDGAAFFDVILVYSVSSTDTGLLEVWFSNFIILGFEWIQCWKYFPYISCLCDCYTYPRSLLWITTNERSYFFSRSPK